MKNTQSIEHVKPNECNFYSVDCLEKIIKTPRLLYSQKAVTFLLSLYYCLLFLFLLIFIKLQSKL